MFLFIRQSLEALKGLIHIHAGIVNAEIFGRCRETAVVGSRGFEIRLEPYRMEDMVGRKPRSDRGVPGVAEPHKLLAITARIGVADTHRFLTKNARFVARLVRSGGFYRPDGLLDGLAPIAADPTMGVADIHLYTFNNVEATEAWRRRFLAALPVALPA
jgi:hypothetical protein